jgi:TRAP-type mannitol/chloroaromatic compound transport system substrate-binding protein
VTVGEFIVNKAKYDALPTDLKEILKTTIQAAYWIHFVPFQEKDTKGVRRTDRVGRQGD